jgi:hypothetical protein
MLNGRHPHVVTVDAACGGEEVHGPVSSGLAQQVDTAFLNGVGEEAAVLGRHPSNLSNTLQHFGRYRRRILSTA